MIPDRYLYAEQCQSVETFEPGTVQFRYDYQTAHSLFMDIVCQENI